MKRARRRMKHSKRVVSALLLLLLGLHSSSSEGNTGPCFVEEVCPFGYKNTCRWSVHRWSVTGGVQTRSRRYNHHLLLDSGPLPGTVTSPELCPASGSTLQCLSFDFRFRQVRKLLPDSLSVSLRSPSGKGPVRVLWNVTAVNRKMHRAFVSVPVGAGEQIVVTGRRFEPPWNSTVTVDTLDFLPRPCNAWTPPSTPLPPPLSSSSLSPPVTSPQGLQHCSETAVCLDRSRRHCQWSLDSQQWYTSYITRKYKGKRRKFHTAYLRHDLQSGTIESRWLCSSVLNSTAQSRARDYSDILVQRRTAAAAAAAGMEGCVQLWVFLQMGHAYAFHVHRIEVNGTCTPLLTVSTLWTAQHRWRFVSLPVRAASSSFKIRVTLKREEWSHNSVVAVDSVSYKQRWRCPVVLPADDVSFPSQAASCVTSLEDRKDVPRHMPTASASGEEEDVMYRKSQLIVRIVVIVVAVVAVTVVVTVAITCHLRKRRDKLKRGSDMAPGEHVEMRSIRNDVTSEASWTRDARREAADGSEEDDVDSLIDASAIATFTTTDTTVSKEPASSHKVPHHHHINVRTSYTSVHVGDSAPEHHMVINTAADSIVGPRTHDGKEASGEPVKVVFLKPSGSDHHQEFTIQEREGGGGTGEDVGKGGRGAVRATRRGREGEGRGSKGGVEDRRSAVEAEGGGGGGRKEAFEVEQNRKTQKQTGERKAEREGDKEKYKDDDKHKKQLSPERNRDETSGATSKESNGRNTSDYTTSFNTTTSHPEHPSDLSSDASSITNTGDQTESFNNTPSHPEHPSDLSSDSSPITNTGDQTESFNNTPSHPERPSDLSPDTSSITNTGDQTESFNNTTSHPEHPNDLSSDASPITNTGDQTTSFNNTPSHPEHPNDLSSDASSITNTGDQTESFNNTTSHSEHPNDLSPDPSPITQQEQTARGTDDEGRFTDESDAKKVPDQEQDGDSSWSGCGGSQHEDDYERFNFDRRDEGKGDGCGRRRRENEVGGGGGGGGGGVYSSLFVEEEGVYSELRRNWAPEVLIDEVYSHLDTETVATPAH
ncbi:uncharacterized protein LOC143286758 [Babylonia areolata]|uniref:uncharacterized protein LOC143286758 n=1 Tax=Babylonia areolata TaxID=304850 RepID=UPI003FD1575F